MSMDTGATIYAEGRTTYAVMKILRAVVDQKLIAMVVCKDEAQADEIRERLTGKQLLYTQFSWPTRKTTRKP